MRALLTALVGFSQMLVGFSHMLAGFVNRQLVELVGSKLARPYTNRQATYDLRRLRRRSIIERSPRTQRISGRA